MNNSTSSQRSVSEQVRLAQDFDYVTRSIQHTADEERRLHEQALTEAYKKHEEVRIVAEQERQRAAEELAYRQHALEIEESLRQEQARKEVAERTWRLEKQKQEAIAAAQAAEKAAEQQRLSNEAAQRALDSRPPAQVPAIQRVQSQSQSTQVPSPVSAAQSVQTFPSPQAQPAETVQPIIQATPTPNAAPKINGINGKHLEPSSQPAPIQNANTKLYMGLPLPSTLPEELQHQYLAYIDVLMNLKNHRKVFMKQILPDPHYQQAKGPVGDDRRFIKKSVSQLTGDTAANNVIMQKVMKILNAALRMPFPNVNLSDFIPSLQDHPIEVNSGYIYLVNIFTKAIFSQFLIEASTDTKKADAIGLFASQVLAGLQLELPNRVSLWPLLLCKFARRCPVLFGVYGDDKTTEGKILLGWGLENKEHVTDQRHAERMAGLSAGWSSITLRNYSLSARENPAPGWFWWRSVALILNVPAEKRTATHYLVLKGMIQHNELKILKLFGDFGRKVIVAAVIGYTDHRGAGEGAAVQGLRLLRDIWEKDMHFRL